MPKQTDLYFQSICRWKRNLFYIISYPALLFNIMLIISIVWFIKNGYMYLSRSLSHYTRSQNCSYSILRVILILYPLPSSILLVAWDIIIFFCSIDTNLYSFAQPLNCSYIGLTFSIEAFSNSISLLSFSSWLFMRRPCQTCTLYLAAELLSFNPIEIFWHLIFTSLIKNIASPRYRFDNKNRLCLSYIF